jgi:hypothetical protein
MVESEEIATDDTIPGLPPLPGVAPLVHAPCAGDSLIWLLGSAGTAVAHALTLQPPQSILLPRGSAILSLTNPTATTAGSGGGGDSGGGCSGGGGGGGGEVGSSGKFGGKVSGKVGGEVGGNVAGNVTGGGGEGGGKDGSNGDNNKGDGNKGGRQATAMKAMATTWAMATEMRLVVNDKGKGRLQGQ